jgi:excisionase family DNA binding protein
VQIPDGSPAPIFVTVKQAADMLAISPWSMYQLLDDGSVDARYMGRRRLVSVASLREYAEGLPNEPASA